MFALRGREHNYNIMKGEVMNKPHYPQILSVGFHYVGTQGDFERFARNIIKDYIAENEILPDSAIISNGNKERKNKTRRMKNESMVVLSTFSRRGRGT